MSTPRDFAIFTDDGQRHTVTAPSLRTALRNFDERKARVVAAVESRCLPVPEHDERPCLVVVLGNPRFVRPDEG